MFHFSTFAAADSGYFTVEIIHDGFFAGSGNNRCYLDGKKVYYDYCHFELAHYKIFVEIVEHLGYEKEGRINMYWLPPGCQLNEMEQYYWPKMQTWIGFM